MSEQLRRSNPEAYRNVLSRLHEAAGRGMWNADADDLVALMGRCWAASPDDRPAFAEITSALAAKSAPPSPAV